MKHTLIYPAGVTDSCRYAGEILYRYGFPTIDHPAPEITHLLLDTPGFRSDGTLRDGSDPQALLSMLPEAVTVIGGNLDTPLLKNHSKIDLLKSSDYLAKNAAITADCALKIAAPMLKTAFRDTPVLILGWGRIGKCLTRLLAGAGFPVTVAARSPEDRAILRALGYEALTFPELPGQLGRFRLLYNTVPAPVLSAEELSFCENCIQVELASRSGLEGSNVVIARGLPGTYAPASSGRLIADTFFRLWKEEKT